MSMPGADGIMIARASVGNPFLFKMSKDLINTGSYTEPSIKEKIACCIRHLEYNVDHKGMRGLLEFRKHYNGYLRGMYNVAPVRQKLVICEKIDDIKVILSDFYNALENTSKLEISNSSVIQRVKCRRD